MHHELASQPYSPLTTLMTADYLLTARDLPGWPGKFKMFTFESLLRASFDVMANNPFADDVLERELKILREIAKQHNLLDLYDELIKNTKRKVFEKNDSGYGFLITHSVRFEGSKICVNNIFDACLAVNFVFNCNRNISIKGFLNFIGNMFKLVTSHKKYQLKDFPNNN